MLETNRKDPKSLYTPRVFLWFPHHLFKDLKCPTCNEKIRGKEFNKKPRARRAIDLNEYDILLSFLLVFFLTFFYCNKLFLLDDYKISISL